MSDLIERLRGAYLEHDVPRRIANMHDEAANTIEALTAELDALRKKLGLIKAHVAGDRFPHWWNDDRTYASRGYISDLCGDAARKDAQP